MTASHGVAEKWHRVSADMLGMSGDAGNILTSIVEDLYVAVEQLIKEQHLTAYGEPTIHVGWVQPLRWEEPS